jgi:hypothetical protein
MLLFELHVWEEHPAGELQTRRSGTASALSAAEGGRKARFSRRESSECCILRARGSPGITALGLGNIFTAT